ncbi:uncharacterized protein STEHIDRAFT_120090 [Stereum hirsutum FP-91666 SS1]|uniref:uncharacterized protein n=1 Tax=Stereum hirsutum (strain FP-91666) TaxID=721885 RepID=UPI000440CDD1|nr:uncharacterized protein STEHIDRAFT_120090 [Stereum hirsutum FP-91666 SS1]EIM87808.1 hypothetical protein STEHIDRAFT_120090 [Stereum hirsutum FP-91666 SS1]
MEEHDRAHCRTEEHVRRSYIKLTSCSEHDLIPILRCFLRYNALDPIVLCRSKHQNFTRSSTSQLHTPQHPATFPSHRSSCHELHARMLTPATWEKSSKHPSNTHEPRLRRRTAQSTRKCFTLIARLRDAVT